jgi:diguanylate cyclase (GGDEF)-like protein
MVLVMMVGLLIGGLLPGETAQAQTVAEPLHKVRIQLKWTHQFQFAGLYAAIDQGYFAAAGLTVELIEGCPTCDPGQLVAEGKAEFGIGNGSLLVSRAQGLPLVAVAPVFQHTPFLIFARRDSGIVRPKDLEGRTLMVESHAEELLAYLSLQGVDLSKVSLVPHSGNVRDLISGRADAMSAYITTEPFYMIGHQIPYQEFNPRLAGIDMYGDTLFTSDAMAHDHPEAVRAVRDAMIRGWHYALDHPNAIIDLIVTRYNPSIDRRMLDFEVEQIRRLMATDLVSIGYMNRDRWQHMSDVFVKSGQINAPVDLNGFLFDVAEPGPDLTNLYLVVAALLLVTLAASGIAWRFKILNQSLHEEIIRRRELEVELKHLAITDPLTGLANRRHFSQRLEEELHRARRLNKPLAVIYIDIDHFKMVNDSLGHTAGDQALRHLGEVCHQTLRDIDFIARVGGEEFIAILIDSDLSQAADAAERLRTKVSDSPVLLNEGAPKTITISLGVAALANTDLHGESLLHRADQALYAAKRNGRNRVELASS